MKKLQPYWEIVVGHARVLKEEYVGWQTISGSFALCQLCLVSSSECWVANLHPIKVLLVSQPEVSNIPQRRCWLANPQTLKKILRDPKKVIFADKGKPWLAK